jgi:hypothetical protein
MQSPEFYLSNLESLIRDIELGNQQRVRDGRIAVQYTAPNIAQLRQQLMISRSSPLGLNILGMTISQNIRQAEAVLALVNEPPPIQPRPPVQPRPQVQPQPQSQPAIDEPAPAENLDQQPSWLVPVAVLGGLALLMLAK